MAYTASSTAHLPAVAQAEPRTGGSMFHDRIEPALWVAAVALLVIFTTPFPFVIWTLTYLTFGVMLFEFINVIRKVEKSWQRRLWIVPTAASFVAFGTFALTLIPLTRFGGPKLLILVFGCSFLADVSAYFVGRASKGKLFKSEHHFFRDVSPNKCLEGWVAGLIVPLAIAVVLKETVGLPIRLWVLLSLVAVGTLIGFGGDLMMSWFKRAAGVKDMSMLLRGHGGLADRCDDLIYVGPYFWLMVVVLGVH